ncbi:MAG: murein biosynthesis integral membrane protein MurJ [Rhizobiales bacterium]|nr:murein biosynthesis integral membrane protein MurJ [Hyphomicrobiales bacterium]MBN9010323.1 murein biosynthesis integral membrane protein MurJ [Hyphomicrobiales bacterium]
MSLLKNFATVGMGTMTSRILGFVRDMFIAAALGSGPVAEAFFVAQRLPNLFRRLFAEGAFASAFVPLFTKTHDGEGPEAGRLFAEESLAALAAMLLAFTAVSEVAMAWLTLALAPGFAADPDKFDLTVLLSRIAFPYLFFISLATLLSGALNGLNRFAAAAFSSSLLNVVLIGALIYVYWTGEFGSRHAGILLTFAITAGGIVQLVFLIFACRYAGLRMSLRWPRWTPGVKRLTRLAGPSVIAGGITQINIVVGTIVASLQAGAVSWLYYADRLYQLPLGIVGIAVGIVLLPDLARALRAGRAEDASHAQNRSMEFAAALTLPASVALFVIPAAIIHVLFERGAFTAADTAATAPALAAYAVGLPAFVAIKVLQPAYFAREDTSAPMWYGGISMVVNVAAAFGLFFLFGHVGIAAATSIAAWVNAVLLFWTLHRRGHFAVDATIRRRIPLLLAGSVLMGAALYAADWALASWLADPHLSVQVIGLAILVFVGLMVFGLFVHFTGAADFKRILKAVLRRG